MLPVRDSRRSVLQVTHYQPSQQACQLGCNPHVWLTGMQAGLPPTCVANKCLNATRRGLPHHLLSAAAAACICQPITCTSEGGQQVVSIQKGFGKKGGAACTTQQQICFSTIRSVGKWLADTLAVEEHSLCGLSRILLISSLLCALATSYRP